VALCLTPLLAADDKLIALSSFYRFAIGESWMSTKNWTVLLFLALLAVTASDRPATSDQERLPCEESSVPSQSNASVVIHPAEKSPIMKGSPPPDELLVTRENWERSHGKL
jgi:hypothetical protein